MEAEPWFFGHIRGAEANRTLLSNSNSDGSFMIRYSDDGRGNDYCLSVRKNKRINHYPIVKSDKDEYFVFPRKSFKNLAGLVDYYNHNADGLCDKLWKPCHQPTPKPIGLSFISDSGEIDKRSLTIIRELGHGQFGPVYEGLWNEDTPVVIKTSKAGYIDTGNFQTEPDAIRALSDNRLYGVCTKGEPKYIVTELMKNSCLLDYLKNANRRLLDLPKLIYIAAQIADEMAYLEAHNYLHCDLAAKNILIGEKNMVKIANFGPNRLIKATEYPSRFGAKYRIKWTAPEAASDKFSTKSDVWSFGIVLYEIITYGQEPYAGMTGAEVIHQVENGYRLPRPPGCPSTLYEIMDLCWSEDPSERPTFETLKWTLWDLFQIYSRRYAA